MWESTANEVIQLFLQLMFGFRRRSVAENCYRKIIKIIVVCPRACGGKGAISEGIGQKTEWAELPKLWLLLSSKIPKA